MRSKLFIIYVFVFFILITGLIGLINYFVDPGYIYFKKNSGVSPDKFAKELLVDKTALVADGWNERILKKSLAKHSGEYDCIIIGSSHIMQISKVRDSGNIGKICPKLLNLGVSGGSFEDLFVFSNLIFKNSKKPEKVFIDITPWFFKFNMDNRYKINVKDYNEFVSIISDDKPLENKNNYEFNLIKNLFNLEYFITSLKNLHSISDTTKIEKPSLTFQYNKGYTKALYLEDGSHLYSSSFIEDSKIAIKNVKKGGGNYKIMREIYHQNTIEVFEKVIQYYQRHKIEVNFILTPYHPNVFKNGETKPVLHMKEVEALALTLSKKYNLPLYGSFFPKKLGCKESEFFDYMHAAQECLNKISFDLKR